MRFFIGGDTFQRGAQTVNYSPRIALFESGESFFSTFSITFLGTTGFYLIPETTEYRPVGWMVALAEFSLTSLAVSTSDLLTQGFFHLRDGKSNKKEK